MKIHENLGKVDPITTIVGTRLMLGAKTYTGAASIAEGTLVLSTFGSGSSGVTVANGSPFRIHIAADKGQLPIAGTPLFLGMTSNGAGPITWNSGDRTVNEGMLSFSTVNAQGKTTTVTLTIMQAPRREEIRPPQSDRHSPSNHRTTHFPCPKALPAATNRVRTRVLHRNTLPMHTSSARSSAG